MENCSFPSFTSDFVLSASSLSSIFTSSSSKSGCTCRKRSTIYEMVPRPGYDAKLPVMHNPIINNGELFCFQHLNCLWYLHYGRFMHKRPTWLQVNSFYDIQDLNLNMHRLCWMLVWLYLTRRQVNITIVLNMPSFAPIPGFFSS